VAVAVNKVDWPLDTTTDVDGVILILSGARTPVLPSGFPPPEPQPASNAAMENNRLVRKVFRERLKIYFAST